MLSLCEHQCSFLCTVVSNFTYANTNTNLSLDSSPSIWESALSWDNTNLPHSPSRYRTAFLSCLSFFKFDLASWIHPLWKPPTCSVHCSIHLVSRCCPVVWGWFGNQGFQDGSCHKGRDGTPHCTLCGLWYLRGDYTSCSRITATFPEVWSVYWRAFGQTYAGKRLLSLLGLH